MDKPWYGRLLTPDKPKVKGKERRKITPEIAAGIKAKAIREREKEAQRQFLLAEIRKLTDKGFAREMKAIECDYKLATTTVA